MPPCHPKSLSPHSTARNQPQTPGSGFSLEYQDSTLPDPETGGSRKNLVSDPWSSPSEHSLQSFRVGDPANCQALPLGRTFNPLSPGFWLLVHGLLEGPGCHETLAKNCLSADIYSSPLGERNGQSHTAVGFNQELKQPSGSWESLVAMRETE